MIDEPLTCEEIILKLIETSENKQLRMSQYEIARRFYFTRSTVRKALKNLRLKKNISVISDDDGIKIYTLRA